MRWHRGRPIPDRMTETMDMVWLIDALMTAGCPDDQLMMGVLRWTGGVCDPARVTKAIEKVKANPPYRKQYPLDSGFENPDLIRCPQCNGVLMIDGPNQDGTLSFAHCTSECRYCWVIANKTTTTHQP